jgi:hypothetical protein
MAPYNRLEATIASGDETRLRMLHVLLYEALTPSVEKIRPDILTIAQEVPDKLPRPPKSADRANPDRYVT